MQDETALYGAKMMQPGLTAADNEENSLRPQHLEEMCIRDRQAAVQLVQTQRVHVHPLQAHQGNIPVDDAIPQHSGKVADTLQEAVCHAGGAPAAFGQLVCACLLYTSRCV